MNSIKAIIVEDERNTREALANLLKTYCPGVSLVGEASNVDEGLALIQQQKPDLVFLDIALGEQSGFELLDKLEVLNFRVIFTTAHLEFAITAFRYNAVDYLLKPIDPRELKEAIEKVSNSHNFEHLQKQISNLAKTLQDGKNAKLAIQTLGATHFIDLTKILHIKGSGTYSTFFLDEGEQIMASKNLKFYNDLLPKKTFFRSHQSHLVNITYIKKIKSEDGYIIELQNGTDIPLVKHRKEALIRLLQ